MSLRFSFNSVFPAFVAHGHIAVVAAEQNLAALGDDVTLLVDAGVDGSLSAAGADGLNLGQGVGKLHEPLRAGEEMGKKVGAQAEAEYRQVLLVHQGAQTVDLLRGEKLGLVGDDDIVLSGRMVGVNDIILRRNDLRGLL